MKVITKLYLFSCPLIHSKSVFFKHLEFCTTLFYKNQQKFKNTHQNNSVRLFVFDSKYLTALAEGMRIKES